MIITDQAKFNAMYWLAQALEIQAVHNKYPQMSAEEKADFIALGMKGFIIDEWIMCEHQDPFMTMKLRLGYGYTWSPSAFQANIEIAPGIITVGGKPYDPNHIPPGAIKNSLDSDDYPPIVVVKPPTPVDTSIIGKLIYGNMYAVRGDKYPDGYRVQDSRGIFVKHMVESQFGGGIMQQWYELLGAAPGPGVLPTVPDPTNPANK